jgi:hypothetical protein
MTMFPFAAFPMVDFEEPHQSEPGNQSDNTEQDSNVDQIRLDRSQY